MFSKKPRHNSAEDSAGVFPIIAETISKKNTPSKNFPDCPVSEAGTFPAETRINAGTEWFLHPPPFRVKFWYSLGFATTIWRNSNAS